MWLSYYLNILSLFYELYSHVSKVSNLSNARTLKPSLKPVVASGQLSLSIHQKNTYKDCYDFFSLNLFKMFMTLGLNPYAEYTRPHAIFNIMFMDHSGHGSITLNLKRCYMRWQGTYALLYNLFYYNHDVVVFGHKIFRIDILAINTVTSPSLKHLFKHITPFYNLRDSLFGSNIDHLITAVKVFKVQTAFVSDSTNHEKMSINLKKCDVYTLGIIPFASNPWVLSYPIPVHASGLFTQYYFIRYIYHIQQQASFAGFNQLYSIWTRF